MEDKSKFFAGVMSAMSAMINLEIPHINVMSKMDLLPKMKPSELERYPSTYERTPISGSHYLCPEALSLCS